ncbi:YadA-like family protein [Moraxella nonliquefaciens]|uniref:YadA-like family protein n=1 Tax=Moraxella nonliquefaciens TaxID=478 RepID=UPI001EF4AA88|nr:YadA-like family protein [Moraxella nonliquefaciens]
MACSEFAKGHTKKAVLSSLLVIGALGMASTANAQASNKSFSLEQIQDLVKGIESELEKELNQTRLTNFQKFMLLSQQANTLTTDDLNNNVQENTQKIGNIQKLYDTQIRTWNKNDKTIEEHEKSIKENKDSLSALTRKTFQNQADIIRNNESIEDLYEYGEEVARSIGEIHTHNQQQNDTIQDLITNSTKNTKRIATAELGIAENKKDALIAKAQASKNKADIQDLAKAQLAGVTVFEELNKNIEENKRDISAVTGKVFKNQIDIQKNNESIEDLYEYGQQVADSIKDIHDHNKAQNDTIQNLITNSTNNTDNIAKNKADADAKFKGVQTDIANNKITLAQHTKKIDDNQRAIEAKLGGKVDLQKLAELKTSVDKNQTDIVKNKADIQDLAKVQQTGVKAIEELNKNIQANKAAADTKFAATEDAINKNAQGITKNTTSISALDTKVSGFDGRINTLDSKVDTFDGRISALDSKVNTFDGRINALDDKFKNGMAAQAALNGLFQPYSVGKVSVSAAIGGYGSKSAIAIGAGYRVNPQLAFKGGTAINMGGSRKGSYNVGVNYEF